jgi:WD40 repeat protein
LTRVDRPAKVVRLSGHRARVRVVTLSADGSRALTGDEEGAVRMWDAATGSLVAALHDHQEPITAVRFSANGRLFVTGGEEGTVRAYYTRVADLVDLARSRVPVSRAP